VLTAAINEGVSVIVAALFLYSASFKAVDHRPLTNTIQLLGMPSRSAALVSSLVVIGEITIGVAVGVFPQSLIGPVLVAIAALLMMAVGRRAMHLGRDVPCGCFSATTTRVLGRAQIAIGSGLLLAAVLMGLTGPSRDSQPAHGLVRLALVSLVLSAAHIVSAMSTIRKVVHDRRITMAAFAA
jgi:hypothetical protein